MSCPALQWEPTYAIPVANAENKALEEEVSMLKEKEELQNEVTNFEERIEAMTSYLKNVRQEINFSQSLYKAKESEIETEHHFKALAEREYGRLKSDIKRLKDEIAALRQKKTMQENTINKTTKKLKNLKEQMNCDEEVLQSWIEELNRSDDNANAIQKYAQQDEGKLEALTLQIEKLTMQANQKRRALDNELTETVTAQMELDRTAEDFRRVHQERQEVIRQWENAIQQMQKRDQEIDHCALIFCLLLAALYGQPTLNLFILFRLNLLNEKNAVLSAKLKLAIEETLSSEEKALRLEEILKEEEKSVEVKNLKELLFKKTQELKEQRDKEKLVLTEIEGGQKLLKNLKSRLRKLDADLLKQQELIYDQDFYIQQVQRRLSRLEGEVNSEEKEILEGKISELKKTLEEKKKTYDVLQSQYRKLQVTSLEYHFDCISLSNLSELTKIDELNLFNERSLEELKKAKHIKQEMMVEDNLLKLELKRLRNTLCNKAEKVLTLEKQQLELKKAIAERSEEIRIHKAMLDSQIRLLDQERHRMSAEFQERLWKIDKLKCRYEIFTLSMMPPEGEEMKSQAYYVIKAAQEKEALQQEGDDLDAKISKAENEIIAMENSLYVLKNWNRNYRNSLKPVPDTRDDLEEKLKLEKEQRDADEKYRNKKRQVKELQESLQSMKQRFEIVESQHALYEEQKKEKEAIILQLKKEIEEQKPKLERVIKQVCVSERKSETETQEERDINLRELKGFNRTINQVIIDIMEANPSLSTAFQKYFDKFNLELPTISSRGASQMSQTPQSSMPSTR
uniref:Coiled-coil domain-containing protein 39 n=1 Tax=Malurus cyaneus samueli TaxID=2593467 RepID=A0A8C5X1D0_9PASS